jgi:hypothetical protein
LEGGLGVDPVTDAVADDDAEEEPPPLVDVKSVV